MTGILWVDDSGRIGAVNAAAESLLGSCIGRRCCDVVLARGDKRRVLCDPSCAGLLAQGEGLERDVRGAEVRGRNARVMCTKVGDHTVVVIEAGEQASRSVLTSRERQALQLVAAGLTSAEIGQALDVSAATVRTHIERARSKLDSRSRAQAVARAISLGEIAATPP